MLILPMLLSKYEMSISVTTFTRSNCFPSEWCMVMLDMLVYPLQRRGWQNCRVMSECQHPLINLPNQIIVLSEW